MHKEFTGQAQRMHAPPLPRACSVHNVCVKCAQCMRTCMQCAHCVRAVCTVGACVQHGMCTGHTVHTIWSRGVMRCYFFFSLDALRANSNISLLRNSNTAATCTSAPLPTLEEYRQFAG